MASIHQMLSLKRVEITEVNSHLVCVLCSGYFVEATTITECLHTFCRSCIVKYVHQNRFCPICDVQLHHSKPWENLRADKIIQDIVYKLVPGLYQNEMARRREFYSRMRGEPDVEDGEERGHLPHGARFYSQDDSISLSLEYYSGVEEDEEDQNLKAYRQMLKKKPKRYLQCPAAVTIRHLKKFLWMKYGVGVNSWVDILYNDESLPEDFSLIDVAYTYSWKRTSPMRLSYRIFSKMTVQTMEPGVDVQNSLVEGENSKTKQQPSLEQQRRQSEYLENLNLNPTNAKLCKNQKQSKSASSGDTASHSSNKQNRDNDKPIKSSNKQKQNLSRGILKKGNDYDSNKTNKFGWNKNKNKSSSSSNNNNSTTVKNNNTASEKKSKRDETHGKSVTIFEGDKIYHPYEDSSSSSQIAEKQKENSKALSVFVGEPKSLKKSAFNFTSLEEETVDSFAAKKFLRSQTKHDEKKEKKKVEEEFRGEKRRRSTICFENYAEDKRRNSFKRRKSVAADEYSQRREDEAKALKSFSDPTDDEESNGNSKSEALRKVFVSKEKPDGSSKKEKDADGWGIKRKHSKQHEIENKRRKSEDEPESPSILTFASDFLKLKVKLNQNKSANETPNEDPGKLKKKEIEKKEQICEATARNFEKEDKESGNRKEEREKREGNESKDKIEKKETREKDKVEHKEKVDKKEAREKMERREFRNRTTKKDGRDKGSKREAQDKADRKEDKDKPEKKETREKPYKSDDKERLDKKGNKEKIDNKESREKADKKEDREKVNTKEAKEKPNKKEDRDKVEKKEDRDKVEKKEDKDKEEKKQDKDKEEKKEDRDKIEKKQDKDKVEKKQDKDKEEKKQAKDKEEKKQAKDKEEKKQDKDKVEKKQDKDKEEKKQDKDKVEKKQDKDKVEKKQDKDKIEKKETRDKVNKKEGIQKIDKNETREKVNNKKGEDNKADKNVTREKPDKKEDKTDKAGTEEQPDIKEEKDKGNKTETEVKPEKIEENDKFDKTETREKVKIESRENIDNRGDEENVERQNTGKKTYKKEATEIVDIEEDKEKVNKEEYKVKVEKTDDQEKVEKKKEQEVEKIDVNESKENRKEEKERLDRMKDREKEKQEFEIKETNKSTTTATADTTTDITPVLQSTLTITPVTMATTTATCTAAADTTISTTNTSVTTITKTSTLSPSSLPFSCNKDRLLHLRQVRHKNAAKTSVTEIISAPPSLTISKVDSSEPPPVRTPVNESKPSLEIVLVNPSENSKSKKKTQKKSEAQIKFVEPPDGDTPADIFEGVLDLSGKSSRPKDTPPSSNSESNLPAPARESHAVSHAADSCKESETAEKSSRKFLEIAQTLVSRKMLSDNQFNPFEGPSDSAAAAAAAMRNLKTLSDTAVDILMAAQNKNFGTKPETSNWPPASAAPPASSKPTPSTNTSTKPEKDCDMTSGLKIPSFSANRERPIPPVPNLQEIYPRGRGRPRPLMSTPITKPGQNQTVRQIPNPFAVLSRHSNQNQNALRSMLFSKPEEEPTPSLTSKQKQIPPLQSIRPNYPPPLMSEVNRFPYEALGPKMWGFNGSSSPRGLPTTHDTNFRGVRNGDERYSPVRYSAPNTSMRRMEQMSKSIESVAAGLTARATSNPMVDAK